MMRALGLIGVLTAALLATGCGYKEGLERPPPMWGDEGAPAPAQAPPPAAEEKEPEPPPLPYP